MAVKDIFKTDTTVTRKKNTNNCRTTEKQILALTSCYQFTEELSQCVLLLILNTITFKNIILFPLRIDWKNYSEKQTISSSTGESMGISFIELSLQQKQYQQQPLRYSLQWPKYCNNNTAVKLAFERTKHHIMSITQLHHHPLSLNSRTLGEHRTKCEWRPEISASDR